MINGSNTTCTVLNSRPTASTGTIVPASHFVSNGVITIAAKVEHIVIRTDSATFPFARYVTTFDAVPPGQHATKINPAANWSGNFRACAIAHPRNGMIEYCATKPTATAFGILST